MKSYLVSIISILIAVIIGAVALPSLPEQFVSHWGPNGEPDGYTTKFIGVLLIPFIMACILLLKAVLPKIDPKRNNFEKFQHPYTIITEMITVFLLLIHVSIVLFNLGYQVDMEFVVVLGISLLFVVLGNYLPKIKHNYSMGVRTPWTLSSETVWAKTHRLAGKAFVLSGLVMGVMAFTDVSFLVATLVPLGLLLVVITMMSYVYYKKEQL